MDKLVLFDLDDTLMFTKQSKTGEGDKKWTEIFKKVFEVDFVMGYKDRTGKTEPEIFLEAATRCGVDIEEARKKLPQAFRLAAQWTEKEDFKLLPGAWALIAEMKMRKIPFGLLTGNSRARTQVKLSKLGLAGEFPIEVFGDEAERRVDLFLVALKKAKEKFGKAPEPEDIWIIGDSPADVKVARHWGAHSIAVATGPYSEEELKAAGAEFVFKDLSDRKRIIDIIKGG